MTRVAIAGVTGFIGKRVAAQLKARHSVVGLVRRERVSMPTALAEVELRACDLLSPDESERALEGAEVAVYLIHSMSPSSPLTSARFEDLDLLLADNFARACAANGVRRIVYVGGLIPPTESLSTHLMSRLEVERALGAHGVPVVALRAGLVVGRDGSSFRIVERLVRRLPAMICPAWTETPTQPIALDDLVEAVCCAVDEVELEPGPIDVGGPEVLTYRQILERTGALLGKRPLLAPVPLITPRLSRLWVSLVTGASRELVAPLIESLAHPMVARHRPSDPAWARGRMPFDEAVAAALQPSRAEEEVTLRARVVADAPRDSRPGVLSVQRLPLLPGAEASWVAQEYLRWLPAAFGPLVRVRMERAGSVHLESPVWPAPLLSLRPDSAGDADCSPAGYHVDGGALTASSGEGGGRFEFRALPANECTLAVVRDFVPSLWPKVHAATQAPAHVAVMQAFGRHLARLSLSQLGER